MGEVYCTNIQIVDERDRPMIRNEVSSPKPRPFALVVDDVPAFCFFMSNLIRSLGFEVLATSNTKAAFLYELTENDIVFIDL